MPVAEQSGVCINQCLRLLLLTSCAVAGKSIGKQCVTLTHETLSTCFQRVYRQPLPGYAMGGTRVIGPELEYERVVGVFLAIAPERQLQPRVEESGTAK